MKDVIVYKNDITPILEEQEEDDDIFININIPTVENDTSKQCFVNRFA